MDIEKRLLTILFTLPSRVDSEPLDVLDREFKTVLAELLLARGEDTSLLGKIEYGSYKYNDKDCQLKFVDYGLMLKKRLKSKNIQFTKLLNQVEGTAKELKMPLKAEEIAAAQRMITMIFLACGAWYAFPSNPLMTNEDRNRSNLQFGQALLDISLLQDLTDINQQSRKLMDAFLNFGSQTPDNENCYQRIEYGIVEKEEGCPIAGLKIVGKNILLSQIMQQIETLPFKLESGLFNFRARISVNDWKIVARVATLIVQSMENPVQRMDQV